MLNRLKVRLGDAYVWMTPEHPRRIAIVLISLMVGFLFLTGFTVGLADGVDSGSNWQVQLNDYYGIEKVIWNDMADTNELTRSFYGLFHWVIVGMNWLAIQGYIIGTFLPRSIIPVVVGIMKAMPWIFVLLMATYLFRLIEVTVDRDFVQR